MESQIFDFLTRSQKKETFGFPRKERVRTNSPNTTTRNVRILKKEGGREKILITKYRGEKRR